MALFADCLVPAKAGNRWWHHVWTVFSLGDTANGDGFRVALIQCIYKNKAGGINAFCAQVLDNEIDFVPRKLLAFNATGSIPIHNKTAIRIFFHECGSTVEFLSACRRH